MIVVKDLLCFIQGKQTTFCKEGEWYLHHILSWYPYRNHPNVKFVCYEDLKKVRRLVPEFMNENSEAF